MVRIPDLLLPFLLASRPTAAGCKDELGEALLVRTAPSQLCCIFYGFGLWGAFFHPPPTTCQLPFGFVHAVLLLWFGTLLACASLQ